MTPTIAPSPPAIALRTPSLPPALPPAIKGAVSSPPLSVRALSQQLGELSHSFQCLRPLALSTQTLGKGNNRFNLGEVQRMLQCLSQNLPQGFPETLSAETSQENLRQTTQVLGQFQQTMQCLSQEAPRGLRGSAENLPLLGNLNQFQKTLDCLDSLLQSARP